MHLASKTFALASLVLAAAACGGSTSASSGTGGSTTSSTGSTGNATTSSTGSAGTGGSGPSAAQACADSTHAQCTERETCSLGSFLNKKTYGDEATCETRLVPSCLSSLMAKGTGQTPTKLEGCVAEYASYACTDYLDGNPPAACVPPAGTQAMGAACGASAQCASSFCAIPQYQICGTCQPLPLAGATCQVGADCGRDLACAKAATAASGTCAVYVASGGACLTNVNPCEAGLSCVGDDAAAATKGTCQASGATVGAPCDGSRKTLPGCNNSLGLVCIPTAAGSAVGTCKAITLVAAGAACGDIGAAPVTGFADCQAGAECVEAAGANTGTCKAAAGDGNACDNDPTKGPPCLAPAKCVPASAAGTSGVCTLPDATTCM